MLIESSIKQNIDFWWPLADRRRPWPNTKKIKLDNSNEIVLSQLIAQHVAAGSTLHRGGRSGPIGRPPNAAKRCRHSVCVCVCELSKVMPMLYATCIVPYDACRTAHAMFRMPSAACRMPHFRAVAKASACAQIRRAKHLNKAFESFSQLLLCIMHYLCTSVNVVNPKKQSQQTANGKQ